MGWESLKAIAALTMIATLADLVMPMGSMRRYARLVAGLLLMLMILTPLMALLRGGLPQELSLQRLLQDAEGVGWP